MGGDDLSHVRLNPKLWNLRPVVKDPGEAMGVPAWPDAYAHVKENQQVWLSGSRPLPEKCPRYPPIRRTLLGVTRKKKCGNGVKGWSRALSAGTLRPCIRLILRFLMHGAGRRLGHPLPRSPGFPLMYRITRTDQPMVCHY